MKHASGFGEVCPARIHFAVESIAVVDILSIYVCSFSFIRWNTYELVCAYALPSGFSSFRHHFKQWQNEITLSTNVRYNCQLSSFFCTDKNKNRSSLRSNKQPMFPPPTHRNMIKATVRVWVGGCSTKKKKNVAIENAKYRRENKCRHRCPLSSHRRTSFETNKFAKHQINESQTHIYLCVCVPSWNWNQK